MMLSLASCKIADIRSESLKNGEELSAEKGKAILEESIEVMGYDKLENFESYSAKSVFSWKPFWSMMPMNALPGNKGKEIEFHFSTNSFDGRIDYLEGRKKGDHHGLQSWQTYQSVNDKPVEFKKDKRRSWGLSTYHYVIEAPNRLLNAPILRYGGTKNMYGKEYDLVYATWESQEPNKRYDQWLVYINKETKFIDLTQLTIRDFFLPFPPSMAHGTVQYLSRTNVDGIYLPSEVSVQLLKPKKHDNYVYKFKLYDYKFDNLKHENLYPNPALDKLGDYKILK
jgi:hypothetical protein